MMFLKIFRKRRRKIIDSEEFVTNDFIRHYNDYFFESYRPASYSRPAFLSDKFMIPDIERLLKSVQHADAANVNLCDTLIQTKALEAFEDVYRQLPDHQDSIDRLQAYRVSLEQDILTAINIRKKRMEENNEIIKSLNERSRNE